MNQIICDQCKEVIPETPEGQLIGWELSVEGPGRSEMYLHFGTEACMKEWFAATLDVAALMKFPRRRRLRRMFSAPNPEPDSLVS